MSGGPNTITEAIVEILEAIRRLTRRVARLEQDREAHPGGRSYIRP